MNSHIRYFKKAVLSFHNEAVLTTEIGERIKCTVAAVTERSYRKMTFYHVIDAHSLKIDGMLYVPKKGDTLTYKGTVRHTFHVSAKHCMYDIRCNDNAAERVYHVFSVEYADNEKRMMCLTTYVPNHSRKKRIRLTNEENL